MLTTKPVEHVSVVSLLTFVADCVSLVHLFCSFPTGVRLLNFNWFGETPSQEDSKGVRKGSELLRCSHGERDRTLVKRPTPEHSSFVLAFVYSSVWVSHPRFLTTKTPGVTGGVPLGFAFGRVDCWDPRGDRGFLP